MQQNELALILGEAYYREALLCAQNKEWDGCREHLRGMSSLLPLDHRAAVLHAQVLLREGHLEASLAALQVAKDLGHDPALNNRMASLILGWDQRKYERLKRRVARRRFSRGCKRRASRFLVNIYLLAGHGIRAVFAALIGVFNKDGDREKPSADEIKKPDEVLVASAAAEVESNGKSSGPDSVDVPEEDPQGEVGGESNRG